MPRTAIAFHGVSKTYPIYDTPAGRIKELLPFRRHGCHREYSALRDVTFQVRRGETFCIIGENGAGKSTLLQLVAGISEPTTGSITVRGRVSALLELGAGFNPEFTGRENVYLNGSILGFSTRAMDDRFPEVERFAEIGEFIDQPAKTYSSGMTVRLAFAVAINVDPDILLIDEALAVGDLYFRQRCMRKVHELRTSGTTILFVSHSMAEVSTLGDRTLWLEAGRVRELGEPAEIVAKYMSAMTDKDTRYLDSNPVRVSKAPAAERATPRAVRTIANVDRRRGSGRAEILGISVLDSGLKPAQMLDPGTAITVRISALAKEPVRRPTIGFLVRNHLGVEFAGTNTTREGTELAPMDPGDIYTVDFSLELPLLYPGHFSFSPSVTDGTLDDYHVLDWIDNAMTLQMSHGGGPIYGYMRLPCKIEVNRTLAPAEEAIG